MTSTPNNNETLRSRARALRLNGLVEHWSEVDGSTWLAPLLQWEEDERAHRSPDTLRRHHTRKCLDTTDIGSMLKLRRHTGRACRLLAPPR